MWLTVIALVLGLLSVFGSAWNFLDSLQRPKKHELRGLLEQSSESLLREYERRLKALESDWDDYYQKFSRLAGRFDRNRALAPPPPPEPPTVEPPLSHSELLKRWRNK